MSDEPTLLGQMLEEREREFMMSKAKVMMRSAVDNLDLGDFRIDGLRDGQSAELPRWVAEELVSMNLADAVEEPFEAEVFRALSKEKMMGPLQLSALPPDFYLKMKRRIGLLSDGLAQGRVKKEEFERLRSGSYDLVGMRLSKLLSLSSSSTSGASLSERLTPEEAAFFTVSQSLSRKWKNAFLGGQR